MAIKVLVISDYRSYHTARPEAEVFIGLAKLGFEIHVMTYDEGNHVKRFREVGIKVVNFHPRKKFDKKERAIIREYAIKEQIQIAHFFNRRAILNGTQALKKLPVKVVLYRGYSSDLRWYDPTEYLYFLNPRVDKIWCNSIGVKELFDKQLGFVKSKAKVINKGHRLAWYTSYEPHNIKAELGLPKDAFLLVNVANNRRMKGIPYLLEAINLLPEDLPIHLIIIGKGMDLASNLQIISDGNRQAQVHMVGFRTDSLNVVKGCDSFVLSSIKGESITKSVIEAMSLGVAPIITDIRGNFELLEHQKSGLVVPSKSSQGLTDAIMKLYNNREMCKEFGENAKQYVRKKLNSEHTIVKVSEMYKKLVSD